MSCDRLGLVGGELFAIDGVKLPSNASKERSGTHAQLLHRAERLERAAQKILDTHRAQDQGTGEQDLDAPRKRQIQRIRAEAQATREFVAKTAPKRNAKGAELKGNVTDNDSAKMATSKGVLQGYSAQAAVDQKHQVIVAAQVLGSGSEQAALLPMVAQASAFIKADTVITADAGYHSEANLQGLKDRNIAAMIADNGMRRRDARYANQAKHKARPDPLHHKRQAVQKRARFAPKDFRYDPATNTCVCPAGKSLYSSGANSAR